MTAKIGIVGGVGWAGTVAYYEALCQRARPAGSPGSPAMAIESLDMATTLASRGKPGDESSWRGFDRIFSDAVVRLTEAGCDLAAIASVTPHARLSSIAENATIPIVSLIDAVATELTAARPKSALVLGTSVTMQGSVFDAILDDINCSKIALASSQVADFTELLDTYFYSGWSNEGRAALIDHVQPLIGNASSTRVILACTDLTPAFPEAGNKALFDAEGLRFLDATSAHVAAILQAARRLTAESI